MLCQALQVLQSGTQQADIPLHSQVCNCKGLENTPNLAPHCALAPQHLRHQNLHSIALILGRKRALRARECRSGRAAQPLGLQHGALISTAKHTLGFRRPAAQQAPLKLACAQSQGLP